MDHSQQVIAEIQEHESLTEFPDKEEVRPCQPRQGRAETSH